MASRLVARLRGTLKARARLPQRIIQTLCAERDGASLKAECYRGAHRQDCRHFTCKVLPYAQQRSLRSCKAIFASGGRLHRCAADKSSSSQRLQIELNAVSDASGGHLSRVAHWCLHTSARSACSVPTAGVRSERVRHHRLAARFSRTTSEN